LTEEVLLGEGGRWAIVNEFKLRGSAVERWFVENGRVRFRGRVELEAL
jgi:hypothetical protein